MSRTLYIGDVHGCADELEKILDAFGYVRGSDTLYQTGDIINKGPDMMRAMKIVEDCGILTVRGNHEEHLIRPVSVEPDPGKDILFRVRTMRPAQKGGSFLIILDQQQILEIFLNGRAESQIPLLV